MVLVKRWTAQRFGFKGKGYLLSHHSFCPVPFTASQPSPETQKVGDRKGTKKKLCDKDSAERSGELSGAICLKTLVLLGNDPVTLSNCSENSLVLCVR